MLYLDSYQKFCSLTHCNEPNVKTIKSFYEDEDHLNFNGGEVLRRLQALHDAVRRAVQRVGVDHDQRALAHRLQPRHAAPGVEAVGRVGAGAAGDDHVGVGLDHGLLALHVSNRHLDLVSVAGAVALQVAPFHSQVSAR